MNENVETTESAEPAEARAEPLPAGTDAIRIQPADYELRSESDGDLPVLVGHFAVFNQWATIRSALEGEFVERMAPGSFTKTIQERGLRIPVLFHHGLDPNVGWKTLGPVRAISEDEKGVYYEVPLLDTDYNRALLPGLRAGLYGSSFRMRPQQTKVTWDAGKRSGYNPDGLPERTIRETSVVEFGPTPIPAYADTLTSVRSMTDDITFERLTSSPELMAQLVERVRHALPEGAGASHSAPVSRTAPSTKRPHYNREEFISWLSRP